MLGGGGPGGGVFEKQNNFWGRLGGGGGGGPVGEPCCGGEGGAGGGGGNRVWDLFFFSGHICHGRWEVCRGGQCGDLAKVFHPPHKKKGPPGQGGYEISEKLYLGFLLSRVLSFKKLFSLVFPLFRGRLAFYSWGPETPFCLGRQKKARGFGPPPRPGNGIKFTVEGFD